MVWDDDARDSLDTGLHEDLLVAAAPGHDDLGRQVWGFGPRQHVVEEGDGLTLGGGDVVRPGGLHVGDEVVTVAAECDVEQAGEIRPDGGRVRDHAVEEFGRQLQAAEATVGDLH